MHLLAHPAAPRGLVRSLEAHAERSADGLIRLAWRLDADLAQVRLPPVAPPARADHLWQHTCFEAFIAGPRTPAYCELNFSPAGGWAAFGFTGYRTGMASLELPAAPDARWRRTARELELNVVLRPGDLLLGAGAEPLRVGLSAVIEERSGTMTYWALGHPGATPDFHHPEAFTLELAGPDPGALRGSGRP